MLDIHLAMARGTSRPASWSIPAAPVKPSKPAKKSGRGKSVREYGPKGGRGPR
ncbi:MAG: hypothetical protein LBT40_05925 [Deltaproteobacteria bacterium]|nr:hypothetical protein [Deltaproteobacteria bacterium]